MNELFKFYRQYIAETIKSAKADEILNYSEWKEETMTVKRIIIEYLKSTVLDEIATHEIELNCIQFGIQMYGKTHSASQYNRSWRLLREDRNLLEESGIEIEEINNESREKHFKIRRIQCTSKLQEETKKENLPLEV